MDATIWGDLKMDKVPNFYYNFLEDYSASVERIADRPDELMQDQQMNHFKVILKNRKTGKSATIYYSMGLGITDLSDENVITGLIGSLFRDVQDSRSQEFKNREEIMQYLHDELGYTDFAQIARISKALEKTYEQVERIGLEEWIDNLSIGDREDLEDY